jgi:glutamate-1-semialdehyde aminotransferase
MPPHDSEMRDLYQCASKVILPGVTSMPSMYGSVIGTDQNPNDLRSYHRRDSELYERIGMELSMRGAQPDADGREHRFLSYSHSEADTSETLTVFEDAVRAAKG